MSEKVQLAQTSDLCDETEVASRNGWEAGIADFPKATQLSHVTNGCPHSEFKEL